MINIDSELDQVAKAFLPPLILGSVMELCGEHFVVTYENAEVISLDDGRKQKGMTSEVGMFFVFHVLC